MTLTAGPDRGQGDTGAPVDAPTTTDVPRRAAGIELIGEMVGSGYREPPALVRRADGQTIQLTPLLYLVLASVDGRRSCAEVAEVVGSTLGRAVTDDNVRTLVDQQLRPAGLLVGADGEEPLVQRSNPLLALRFKYAVTDPERTRRVTAPFAALFHPVVVVAVLAAFLAVSWWVLVMKGLASAAHEAFDKPGLLLLVFAVTVLSAGFHEFGHAAAARRGGATPGAMGAGLYLVWPAFYTDVTDSYRLGRGGRVRTDLGGLYFNAIVAVVVTGVWWATAYDALLLVVATQILQMVRQLTPLVRFDGYHVLADVTGVPDLFQRIRPTLLGLLPWRWRHPETTTLKPWARAVVTIWVLAVVPLLAFTLFVMVVTLPRLVGTTWVSMQQQAAMMARAWGEMNLVEMAARALALVAVTLPVLAVGYILVRLVRRVVGSVWRRTRGKPLQRALAGLVAIALVAGLAYAWWPRPGSYRPIQPWEGGTLTQVASAAPRPATGLATGQYGTLTTAWPEKAARPTADRPQLALVLVPRASGRAEGADAETVNRTDPRETPPTDPSQAWVFPFDKPLAPDPGDNQSMAVTTTDGQVTYDVAFALVWVTDDSPALNVNEAYAFASCQDCAAVSVAFQVVLVTGDNHVAAPQNISAAVNYDCVNCLTYALATQLFVTLDGPLSDAGTAELDALWREIAAFGAGITEVPLSEVRDRLTAFEQQILAIIEREQGPLSDGVGSADPSQEAASSGPEPSPGDPADAVGPTDEAPSPDEEVADDGSTDEEPSADGSGAPDGSDPTVESPTASPTPAEPEADSDGDPQQAPATSEPDPATGDQG